MFKNESILKRLPRLIKKSKIFRQFWAKRIIKNMKKYNKNSKLKTEIPYINKSGVVFSFDDSFRIHQWHQYGRAIFEFYDIRVTFNINAFHQFEEEREHTQEEIDLLLDLQSDGHEIVHHGFRHRNAIQYSNVHGLNKWIEDDIIPLFEWMEKQSHSINGMKFKKPVSYAYPGSAYNNKTNSAIIPKYFNLARGHLSGDNLVNYGQTGFIPSICIDRNYFSELNTIKEAIKIAKENGKILVLMCHSILPDNINWQVFNWGQNSEVSGEFRISPNVIKEIIKEVKKKDMEFYTLAEVSGIATFSDINFEKYIRKIISIPKGSIMIKDLISINELDLSNESISNLDGIQYFLELKKIHLLNNSISNFRLLHKLPKLRTIIIN